MEKITGLREILFDPKYTLQRKLWKMLRLPMKYALRDGLAFGLEHGFIRRPLSFSVLPLEKLLLRGARQYEFHGKNREPEEIPDYLWNEYFPAEKKAVFVCAEGGLEQELKVTGSAIDVRKKLMMDRRSYSVYEMVMPAIKKASWVKNVITMFYYEQKPEGRFPTVFVYPISGNSELLTAAIATYFASHGYNVFHIQKPKENEDVRYLVDEAEPNMAAVISRYIQCIDIAVQQQKVDKERLATFGISLGGITASLIACLDQRIKAHVIGLAGMPFYEILRYSTEIGVRRRWEKCKRDNEMEDDELANCLRKRLSCDPSHLWRYVDPAKIYQVIAGTSLIRKTDTAVPTSCQFILWEALGNPKRTAVPYGHYGAILLLPHFLREGRMFIEERLRR